MVKNNTLVKLVNMVKIKSILLLIEWSWELKIIKFFLLHLPTIGGRKIGPKIICLSHDLVLM